MLRCDQTITVIRCDGEMYGTTQIEGVSWFEKSQIKVEGTGLVFANAVQIRIPAASALDMLPQVGDQVIKGRFPIGFIVKAPADIAMYHPRKVMAVGDNRRGSLSHVLVVCQ